MTRDLPQLRSEITSIDEQILALLTERMNLSVLVAIYKKNHQLPVFDQKREQEMLQAYDAKVDFEVSAIFSAILEESKRIQKGVLS